MTTSKKDVEEGGIRADYATRCHTDDTLRSDVQGRVGAVLGGSMGCCNEGDDVRRKEALEESVRVAHGEQLVMQLAHSSNVHAAHHANLDLFQRCHCCGRFARFVVCVCVKKKGGKRLATSPELTSPLRGCLVGLCLGDALGNLVDGADRKRATRFVRKTLRGNASAVLPRLHRAARELRGLDSFGQVTDDSQLAIELLRGVVEARGRFDASVIAARFAALFRSGLVFGPGLTTAKAAARLNRGVPWDEAGCPTGMCGNSPAVRAACLGCLPFAAVESAAAAAAAADDSGTVMVRCCCDQARITHKDPRCQAGAVAMAVAVATLAAAPTAPPHHVLRRVVEATRPVSAAFADCIACTLCPLLERRGVAAAAAADRLRNLGCDFADGTGTGISPFVTASVAWALWACLSRCEGEGYLDVVGTAISGGGDCDSCGALAGALCGAQLGLAAIPPQLTACLTDRGAWHIADLLALADETALLWQSSSSSSSSSSNRQ